MSRTKIPVEGPWPSVAQVAKRLGVAQPEARRIAKQARAAVSGTAAKAVVRPPRKTRKGE